MLDDDNSMSSSSSSDTGGGGARRRALRSRCAEHSDDDEQRRRRRRRRRRQQRQQHGCRCRRRHEQRQRRRRRASPPSASASASASASSMWACLPTASSPTSVCAWWTWSYAADWLCVVVVGLVVAAVCDKALTPHHRALIADDPMLSLPNAASEVPSWALPFVAAAPIVVFAVAQVWLRSAHDFHHALLGLFEALVLELAFTEPLKVAVGRYRPDFFAHRAENHGVATADMRKSFPSGHSSLSFAALLFVACYIAGKLRVFAARHSAPLWRVLVAALPIAGAVAVAVSRVVDYHHNFGDIIAGSAIGSVAALVAYNANFFPLSSARRCHLPKGRAGTPADAAARYSALDDDDYDDDDDDDDDYDNDYDDDDNNDYDDDGGDDGYGDDDECCCNNVDDRHRLTVRRNSDDAAERGQQPTSMFE